MARTTLILVVGVVLLVSTVVFGASAFTSASVERDATMDVVTDDEGLIALQDNTSGSLVSDDSGQLTIDLTAGGAAGANADANFTFGSTADPVTTHAFNVTNNAGQEITADFSYAFDDDPDTSETNLHFRVYDDSGDSLGAFSGQTDLAPTLSDGQTVYVVLTVDTTGLTSNDDLSGTLKIGA